MHRRRALEYIAGSAEGVFLFCVDDRFFITADIEIDFDALGNLDRFLTCRQAEYALCTIVLGVIPFFGVIINIFMFNGNDVLARRKVIK